MGLTTGKCEALPECETPSQRPTNSSSRQTSPTAKRPALHADDRGLVRLLRTRRRHAVSIWAGRPRCATRRYGASSRLAADAPPASQTLLTKKRGERSRQETKSQDGRARRRARHAVVDDMLTARSRCEQVFAASIVPPRCKRETLVPPTATTTASRRIHAHVPATRAVQGQAPAGIRGRPTALPTIGPDFLAGHASPSCVGRPLKSRRPPIRLRLTEDASPRTQNPSPARSRRSRW